MCNMRVIVNLLHVIKIPQIPRNVTEALLASPFAGWKLLVIPLK